MPYEILRDKESLDGRTDVIEIGPGKYQRKHFLPGFIFIDECDFSCAEASIRKYHPSYNHYEMNNISSDSATLIIEEWRKIAATILNSTGQEIWLLLGYHHTPNAHAIERIYDERKLISVMLNEIANYVETLLKRNSWISILGV
ncbi:MAG: hypothetical protein JAY74_20700 [Candidatus Thiodiazotropha taylori]|nr:hypothetical protein [Candidatus Thiodiazotropha taylori]